MGKIEFVQSVWCQVAWSNLNVRDGWLCRGESVNKSCKCKYGEYVSFEYLLFLYSLLKE